MRLHLLEILSRCQEFLWTCALQEQVVTTGCRAAVSGLPRRSVPPRHAISQSSGKPSSRSSSLRCTPWQCFSRESLA